MYVAPRPDAVDDPLFAVRLAAVSAVALALVPVIQPSMPPLLVAIPAGLMAGMRRRFDPAKAFGGPVAMMVMVWVISAIVLTFQPMPFVLVAIMSTLYFLGFYLIQKTGNPIGMLILIVSALMSVMGLNSIEAMRLMRGAFTEACVLAAILIPMSYAIIRPRSRERLEEIYAPSAAPHAISALIRAAVLMVISFSLYSVIDSSNIILVVAPVFVLVFPTRQRLFAEARERTLATLMGAGVAGCILVAVTITAHFPLVVGFTFLGALYLTNGMMFGRHPSMVYQFSLSVMLALTVGALTTQEPGYAAMTRVVLTLTGAVGAAYATALLEALIIPRTAVHNGGSPGTMRVV